MKEKLFSRATQSGIQKKDFRSIFLSLILLPLLCMPSFSIASAVEQSIPLQDQQAIIYVGENTFVYGVSEISNATIIKIEKVKVSKNKIEPQKKHQTLKKQALAQKETNNRALNLLQEKINRKVKSFYRSSSQDSESIKFTRSKLIFSAITSNLSSFKFSYAVVSNTVFLNSTFIQLSKKKYYTFLTYLTFIKCKSPFLRGPPQLI